MKATEDIINLWKTWRPSLAFVCPSQVACYYWKKHLLNKSCIPLFPNGEINDVAAVLAGSKPSAIIDIRQCNGTLEELTHISIKEGIFSKYIRDRSTLVFAKGDILDEIHMAIDSGDKFSLGILLGYPEESVKKFVERFATNANLTKTSSQTFHNNRHKINDEYINSLDAPEFKIHGDWFGDDT
jgi:hypothetical protein